MPGMRLGTIRVLEPLGLRIGLGNLWDLATPTKKKVEKEP